MDKRNGTAQLFRKKQIVVEAMQYDGSMESQRAIVNWTNGMAEGWCDSKYHLRIYTREGVMRADAYDWIIKGVEGEFYPCKPHIFDQSYELGSGATGPSRPDRISGLLTDAPQLQPKEVAMSTTTVDPHDVADSLGMDTHDLTKLLCGFSSDKLMTLETWLEKSYEPQSLEEFDEAVAAARRHLEAAHGAWAAWIADNPEYAQTSDEG